MPAYDLYFSFFIFICFLIGIRILNEFRDGFDWFSGSLYFIIFLVCCGLVYLMTFGVYYAIIE